MNEKQLFKALLDASNCRNENILSSLLKAFSEILRPKMCSLWKVNSAAKSVSIRARYNYNPDPKNTKEYIHDLEGSLIGHICNNALNEEDYYLDIPDIRSEPYWSYHRSQERVNRLKLKRFISIPILKYDKLPVLAIDAVFNFYPDESFSFSKELANLLKDQFSLAISRARLLSKEELTRLIIDNYEKKASKDLASVLHPIISQILKKFIKYEGCSVFIWDSFMNRLALCQTTGIVGKPPRDEIFYYIGEGFTGRVAETCSLLRIKNLSEIPEESLKNHQAHKWQEETTNPGKSFLAFPIMSPSEPDNLIGVIRFTNRLSPISNVVDYFSEEDTSLIKHACNLIALYIENEQNERIRASFANSMAHEMLTPAVAIRATSNRLSRKWNTNTLNVHQINRDLKDIQNYSELQIALTNTVRFLEKGFSGNVKRNKYQIVKCRFEEDVIIPSKKLVIPIARNEGVLYDNIKIVGFFPNIFADKYAFRQVFFNLLTNTIKYRIVEQPEKFETIIHGVGKGLYNLPKYLLKRTDDPDKIEGFLIRVDDFGIGIDEEEINKIFLLGYRKKGIEKTNVRGLGVGLKVTKTILGDFGCKIWVGNLKKPTRLNILIPTGLVSSSYFETADWVNY